MAVTDVERARAVLAENPQITGAALAEALWPEPSDEWMSILSPREWGWMVGRSAKKYVAANRIRVKARA